MRKAKVLRVITRLNVGGPSLQVMELGKRLNHEFESWTMAGFVPDNENSMEYLMDEPWRFLLRSGNLQREINLVKDKRAIDDVYKAITVFRPDIVHTHQAKAGFVARFAASFFKNPPKLVHTYHGHTFDGYFGKFKGTVIKEVESHLAKKTDVIIALNDSQKEDIVNNLRCDPDKVRVVPLGFDLSNFEFNVKTASNERFAVGIVGRLAPIKNHTMFLEVVELVRDMGGSNIHFYIVGDGEEKQRLVSEIGRLGIGNKVFFLGTLGHEDMPHFYNDMDAVVCTSLNEGTPVSIIEAQASGVPVISTNVGGVRDMHHIIKVKSGDSLTMAKQLVKWSNRYPMFDSLHTISENVKKKYSIDRLVSDITDIYRELCG